MPQILYNAIMTPDGTILQSKSIHDFVSYEDKVSGEVYFVDGGLAYLKRSVNKVPATELSLTTDDPHDVVRQRFTWGTYGKITEGDLTKGVDGKQQKKYVKLKDLTDQHIANILRTQKQLPDFVQDLFRVELVYRDYYNLNIRTEGNY